MALKKKAKAQPKAKEKAKAVNAGKKKGKSGKKAWIISGVLVAVLLGLVAQTLFIAKKQASLKFDMLRTGSIIAQGRDLGQAMGPIGLAGDKEDNLYFLEGDGDLPPRLQKFNPQNGVIGKFEATKPDQIITLPAGIDTDAEGNAYVLQKNGVVRVISPDLKPLRVFDTKQEGCSAIGVDSKGQIYIANQPANRISVYSAEGVRVREFGAPGTNSGDISNPLRMVITQLDKIVVLEGLPTGMRLKVFSEPGKVKKAFLVDKVQPCPPVKMGVDAGENLYFNDHLGDGGLVIYDLNGALIGTSKGTKDGQLFISPGSVGANKWTASVYLHTIPGLIKCTLPEGK